MTVLAIAMTSVLTGCVATPEDSISSKKTEKLIAENLEKYAQFKEDNIKPKFKNELASCYGSKDIKNSDGYTVYVFNTEITNNDGVFQPSELIETSQVTLKLYRDLESEATVTLTPDSTENYSFKIVGTNLSSVFSSTTNSKYVSTHTEINGNKGTSTVSDMDWGTKFIIAETAPGNFAYSFRKSELAELKKELVNDVEVTTPSFKEYGVTGFTNKTNTQNSIHSSNKNLYGFSLGKDIVTTKIIDLYICEDPELESPKKEKLIEE